MTAGPVDVELVVERAALLASLSGREHVLFDRESGLEVWAQPGLPPIVWQPEPREHADLSWYLDMVAAQARPVSWVEQLFARLRHPSDGA